jgi:transcription elongation factor Elf1
MAEGSSNVVCPACGSEKVASPGVGKSIGGESLQAMVGKSIGGETVQCATCSHTWEAPASI